MTDTLNYPNMIDRAMRGLVRDALRQVAKSGLPGEHHFYISFDTDYPGVQISDHLRDRYPEDITIVLQHQFWDFKVEEHQFQVSLSFGGVPEKLVVPYAALTAFADPSVKFGLQFQQIDDLEELMMEELEEFSIETPDNQSGDAGSAEVISLDAFRKK